MPNGINSAGRTERTRQVSNFGGAAEGQAAAVEALGHVNKALVALPDRRGNAGKDASKGGGGSAGSGAGGQHDRENIPNGSDTSISGPSVRAGITGVGAALRNTGGETPIPVSTQRSPFTQTSSKTTSSKGAKFKKLFQGQLKTLETALVLKQAKNALDKNKSELSEADATSLQNTLDDAIKKYEQTFFNKELESITKNIEGHRIILNKLEASLGNIDRIVVELKTAQNDKINAFVKNCKAIGLDDALLGTAEKTLKTHAPLLDAEVTLVKARHAEKTAIRDIIAASGQDIDNIATRFKVSQDTSLVALDSAHNNIGDEDLKTAQKAQLTQHKELVDNVVSAAKQKETAKASVKAALKTAQDNIKSGKSIDEIKKSFDEVVKNQKAALKTALSTSELYTENMRVILNQFDVAGKECVDALDKTIGAILTARTDRNENFQRECIAQAQKKSTPEELVTWLAQRTKDIDEKQPFLNENEMGKLRKTLAKSLKLSLRLLVNGVRGEHEGEIASLIRDEIKVKDVDQKANNLKSKFKTKMENLCTQHPTLFCDFDPASSVSGPKSKSVESRKLPEQLQEAVTKYNNLVDQLAVAAKTVQEKKNAITAALDAAENGSLSVDLSVDKITEFTGAVTAAQKTIPGEIEKLSREITSEALKTALKDIKQKFEQECVDRLSDPRAAVGLYRSRKQEAAKHEQAQEVRAARTALVKTVNDKIAAAQAKLPAISSETTLENKWKGLNEARDLYLGAKNDAGSLFWNNHVQVDPGISSNNKFLETRQRIVKDVLLEAVAIRADAAESLLNFIEGTGGDEEPTFAASQTTVLDVLNIPKNTRVVVDNALNELKMEDEFNALLDIHKKLRELEGNSSTEPMDKADVINMLRKKLDALPKDDVYTPIKDKFREVLGRKSLKADSGLGVGLSERSLDAAEAEAISEGQIKSLVADTVSKSLELATDVNPQRSATKIQAHFRGMKGRQEAEKLRQEEAKAEAKERAAIPPRKTRYAAVVAVRAATSMQAAAKEARQTALTAAFHEAINTMLMSHDCPKTVDDVLAAAANIVALPDQDSVSEAEKNDLINQDKHVKDAIQMRMNFLREIEHVKDLLEQDSLSEEDLTFLSKFKDVAGNNDNDLFAKVDKAINTNKEAVLEKWETHPGNPVVVQAAKEAAEAKAAEAAKAAAKAAIETQAKETKAATTIQAVVRGHQGRVQAKATAEAAAKATAEAAAKATAEAAAKAAIETQAKETKAATTIQAVVRGHQGRVQAQAKAQAKATADAAAAAAANATNEARQATLSDAFTDALNTVLLGDARLSNADDVLDSVVATFKSDTQKPTDAEIAALKVQLEKHKGAIDVRLAYKSRMKSAQAILAAVENRTVTGADLKAAIEKIGNAPGVVDPGDGTNVFQAFDAAMDTDKNALEDSENGATQSDSRDMEGIGEAGGLKGKPTVKTELTAADFIENALDNAEKIDNLIRGLSAVASATVRTDTLLNRWTDIFQQEKEFKELKAQYSSILEKEDVIAAIEKTDEAFEAKYNPTNLELAAFGGFLKTLFESEIRGGHGGIAYNKKVVSNSEGGLSSARTNQQVGRLGDGIVLDIHIKFRENLQETLGKKLAPSISLGWTEDFVNKYSDAIIARFNYSKSIASAQGILERVKNRKATGVELQTAIKNIGDLPKTTLPEGEVDVFAQVDDLMAAQRRAIEEGRNTHTALVTAFNAALEKAQGQLPTINADTTAQQKWDACNAIDATFQEAKGAAQYLFGDKSTHPDIKDAAGSFNFNKLKLTRDPELAAITKDVTTKLLQFIESNGDAPTFEASAKTVVNGLNIKKATDKRFIQEGLVRSKDPKKEAIKATITSVVNFRNQLNALEKLPVPQRSAAITKLKSALDKFPAEGFDACKKALQERLVLIENKLSELKKKVVLSPPIKRPTIKAVTYGSLSSPKEAARQQAEKFRSVKQELQDKGTDKAPLHQLPESLSQQRAAKAHPTAAIAAEATVTTNEQAPALPAATLLDTPKDAAPPLPASPGNGSLQKSRKSIQEKAKAATTIQALVRGHQVRAKTLEAPKAATSINQTEAISALKPNQGFLNMSQLWSALEAKISETDKTNKDFKYDKKLDEVFTDICIDKGLEDLKNPDSYVAMLGKYIDLLKDQDPTLEDPDKTIADRALKSLTDRKTAHPQLCLWVMSANIRILLSIIETNADTELWYPAPGEGDSAVQPPMGVATASASAVDVSTPISGLTEPTTTKKLKWDVDTLSKNFGDAADNDKSDDSSILKFLDELKRLLAYLGGNISGEKPESCAALLKAANDRHGELSKDIHLKTKCSQAQEVVRICGQIIHEYNKEIESES